MCTHGWRTSRKRGERRWEGARRAAQTGARGGGRPAAVLSAPLHSPCPQRETHQNDPQRTKRANIQSLLFDSKIPSEAEEFSSPCPGGLPGGRGAQAPGAAQPPELQEVGRTSVTALQGSGAGVPGPRSGVEINTAPAARRRCRRCPAGPRGQPCCSASCRPLPTHGRSPQRAVREEQRPLFCHGQHQARPQVPWAARVPSRSLPATGSREEISRGSAGHI